MRLPAPSKLAKHTAYALVLLGLLAVSACGGGGHNGGGGGPSSNSGIADNLIPAAPTSAPTANSAGAGASAGPGPGLTAPTLAPPPPVSTQPVPLQITFPLTKATPAPTSLIQSSMQRRLQYVSTANTQMAVTITPIGASSPSYTSSNTPCTTSACV